MRRCAICCCVMRAESHRYEEYLRQTLYQWKHFPVDMVVEPFIRVPMAIHNTGFGIEVQENIAVSDATNSVVGHYYNNQFRTMDDLEKVQMPLISHDPARNGAPPGSGARAF